jgi:hypothetical protein
MSRGDQKFQVFVFDGKDLTTAKELSRTGQVRPAGDDRISRFKTELRNDTRSNA